MTKVQLTIKYSIYIGIFYVLTSLTLYFFGINYFTESKNVFLSSLPLMSVMLTLVFSMKDFQNKFGYLNLKNYFAYSFLCGIWASIILAVFFVIFSTKLAPETIEILKKIIFELYKNYLPEQQLNVMVEKMNSPILLFFSSFIGNTINFAIFSFFFALFNSLTSKNKKQ